jgi:hypothetical protein
MWKEIGNGLTVVHYRRSGRPAGRHAVACPVPTGILRRRRPAAPPPPSRTLTPLLLNLIEGRSGSTLLMRNLDHPSIAFDRAYPYEHRYLTYLAHLLFPSGEPFDPAGWTQMDLLTGPGDRFGPLPFDPQSLDRRELRVRLVRHAWAALSEALEAGAGRPLTYYAEKALGHSLPLLAEAGIAGTVVNLVRDPRDVVASIRAMDRKRGFYGFGRTEEMTEADYLVFVLGRMRANLATMVDVDPLHRSTVVRYEDLVLDRAGTLARLGEFLDLRLTMGPVEDLHGVPAEVHATASDPASSVGRWRNELAAEEAAAVEEALGSEMERFGYR